MRPHEQEDIAAGHEFKMRKEYEQVILVNLENQKD